MNGRLYVLLTTQCNLSCPHCTIRDQNDNFNEELFFKELDAFQGKLVIMSGEPSIYEDRLDRIVHTQSKLGKKMTITTNLIKLNDHLLSLYKEIGSIGSSWNCKRFTVDEYHLWLNNLQVLKQHGMHVGLLVTLDHDLIEMDPTEFINIIQDWDPEVISGIKFEQLLARDTNPEWFERVDDWLCEVYSMWNVKIPMVNTTIEHYFYDCRNVYTLHPNGVVTFGCPHEDEFTVPTECYSCDRVAICKPCIRQKYCSYPKKFYELVNKDKAKKEEKKDD